MANKTSNDGNAAGPGGNPLQQAASIIEELRLLEAWNQGLCQRANQHKIECAGSAPLVPGSACEILGCSAAGAGAKVERSFSALVDAVGPSGQSVPVSLTGNGLVQRLRIRVNGQLAYDRDGINHTFSRESLEFTDPTFRNNRAWLALMARKDCGVVSP